MNIFDYVRAKSVAEAIAAWRPGAAFLAGGTNLVDLMKIGVLQPQLLIDITRVDGLGDVEILADGSMRIGALVKNSDLACNSDVIQHFPMLAEALLSGASGQLRNAATVGGNLMQHTRCAYFQDAASACNRREPGSGCSALGGQNDTLAIFGWSEGCIATHPSDFCIPLAALDAKVEVQGPSGRRDIAFADFHRLPGDTPALETALQPGELVLAVCLPAAATSFRDHSRYVKVRERTSYAFALVSAAAALRMEGGVIAEARFALGAVAAKPWRVLAAEALLTGETPGPEVFARAADAALAGAKPSGDNEYKIELVRRTVIRALTMAAAGTPARTPPFPASAFRAAAHV